jgi:DNA-binding CsgD family transcriptional regulator
VSSIQTCRESPTELRLGYRDFAARQLIMVIRGSTDSGTHASPSSPLVAEASAINAEAGYAPVLITSLVLAAWRGRESRALELIATTIEDAPTGDQRRAIAFGDYARAVLYNGFGRYADARAAAERACMHEDLGSFARSLPELVEAGARTNARSTASEALGRLEEQARACCTDWALGVRARSAALLSEGEQAERLYREAIELLGRSPMPAHLARAQLVYGEWLRRENRRVDARVPLRAAHDIFSRIGAEAFADRAVRELLATGETARKRTDEARAELTPQEAQIARLAREGLSNPEIGARLFISHRTVQYHLRKVFRKLAITSRNQLGRIPPRRLGLVECAATGDVR